MQSESRLAQTQTAVEFGDPPFSAVSSADKARCNATNNNMSKKASSKAAASAPAAAKAVLLGAPELEKCWRELGAMLQGKDKDEVKHAAVQTLAEKSQTTHNNTCRRMRSARVSFAGERNKADRSADVFGDSSCPL